MARLQSADLSFLLRKQVQQLCVGLHQVQLRLLGQTVERVVAVEANALEIQFSNNETLTLYPGNEAYESFQITAPGTTIVV
jgi:hypothetical protein